MTRDRKILALLALLALVSLSCTALSRLFRAAPESGTLPGAEAPATVAPESILPVSTEVRRLELAPSPTPFHVTGPDDVRSILDLGRPDGTDYFDVPDNWYDYDTPGYAAYRVEDSHLFGIDYNPSDRPIYWSYTNVSSGNTYAEITATNGDCVGHDAVALVIRVDPEETPSGYSLEVACAGEFRFRSLRSKKLAADLIDWTASDVILTGKDAANRLGIWGYQGHFVVFINGTQVGEYIDRDYDDTYGYFAAYLQAAQTFDLTATFDDFAFWHIPFIP